MTAPLAVAGILALLLVTVMLIVAQSGPDGWVTNLAVIGVVVTYKVADMADRNNERRR